MPVHDWSKVTARTFHAFHNSWITHIQEALNDGFLPEGYYALGEQRAGEVGPDVLTLHAEVGGPNDSAVDSTWSTHQSERCDNGGAVAVAECPPLVDACLESANDAAFYATKQRTVTINTARATGSWR